MTENPLDELAKSFLKDEKFIFIDGVLDNDSSVKFQKYASDKGCEITRDNAVEILISQEDFVSLSGKDDKSLEPILLIPSQTAVSIYTTSIEDLVANPKHWATSGKTRGAGMSYSKKLKERKDDFLFLDPMPGQPFTNAEIKAVAQHNKGKLSVRDAEQADFSKGTRQQRRKAARVEAKNFETK